MVSKEKTTMKKYKVYYTFYDGTEWAHSDGERIVEAQNEDEAKALVAEMSGPWGDYRVDKVEEAGS